MSFNHGVEDIVQVVEAAGVAVLVIGGAVALARAAIMYAAPDQRSGAYRYCRRQMGRSILLGLEILIVADIIRTVIVSQTATAIAGLGAIVAIRIILSWSLDVELDGVWPWRKGRTPTG